MYSRASTELREVPRSQGQLGDWCLITAAEGGSRVWGERWSFSLMGEGGSDEGAGFLGLVLFMWKLDVCHFEGHFAAFLAVLVPDRDVRVSVKALALSCVGAAVALHPESFFSKLYKVPLDTMEYPGMLQVHSLFLMFNHCFENYFRSSWLF